MTKKRNEENRNLKADQDKLSGFSLYSQLYPSEASWKAGTITIDPPDVHEHFGYDEEGVNGSGGKSGKKAKSAFNDHKRLRFKNHRKKPKRNRK